MKRKPSPAVLTAMKECSTTLKTLSRGRRKSLTKMNDAELGDELSRIVGKISAATAKVNAARNAIDFAEIDREFEEWQRDEQPVYEVVCSQTGSVVHRYFYDNQAAEAIQEMIDRDGCEPGEYIVRKRLCKLQPVS